MLWLPDVDKSAFFKFFSDSLVKDLFTDTAAILDSIVSDIYYGMLRGLKQLEKS